MNTITLDTIAAKLSAETPILLLLPDGCLEVSTYLTSLYREPIITFAYRPERPASISQADLFELDENVVGIFVLGAEGTWASMVRDENYHSGFGFGSIDKALYLQQQYARTREEVLHALD